MGEGGGGGRWGRERGRWVLTTEGGGSCGSDKNSLNVLWLLLVCIAFVTRPGNMAETAGEAVSLA